MATTTNGIAIYSDLQTSSSYSFTDRDLNQKCLHFDGIYAITDTGILINGSDVREGYIRVPLKSSPSVTYELSQLVKWSDLRNALSEIVWTGEQVNPVQITSSNISISGSKTVIGINKDVIYADPITAIINKNSFIDHAIFNYNSGPGHSSGSSPCKITVVKNSTIGNNISIKIWIKCKDLLPGTYDGSLIIYDGYYNSTTVTISSVTLNNWFSCKVFDINDPDTKWCRVNNKGSYGNPNWYLTSSQGSPYFTSYVWSKTPSSQNSNYNVLISSLEEGDEIYVTLTTSDGITVRSNSWIWYSYELEINTPTPGSSHGGGGASVQYQVNDWKEGYIPGDN